MKTMQFKSTFATNAFSFKYILILFAQCIGAFVAFVISMIAANVISSLPKCITEKVPEMGFMSPSALEARQRPGQRTQELIFYILQHPTSTQEIKNLALQVKLELEAKLPPKDFEAARECVVSKSLDEFVAQYLVSF